MADAGSATKETAGLAAVEPKVLALKRRKYRYVILKIDPETLALGVDKLGKTKEGFPELCKALPEGKSRYLVYDHEYKTMDGRLTSKMYWVLWTPDGAPTTSKVLYSSQESNMQRLRDHTIESFRAASVRDLQRAMNITDKVDEEEDTDDEEGWDPDA